MAASIFLYNSELWNVTKTLEKKINSFQRRLLRYVLNIKWPQKISNEKLGGIIKMERWSHTISIRRMSWLGHLFRLPTDTPARQALKLIEEEGARRRGALIKTWLMLVKSQIESKKV